MPQEFVEVESEAGLYGGLAGASGLKDDAAADWDQTGRGPGYARLRASRRNRGVIDGRATVVEELPSTGAVACGVRVFHQKFGYGTVQAKDGNKLEIVFEKAGTKKVLDSFVVPA